MPQVSKKSAMPLPDRRLTRLPSRSLSGTTGLRSVLSGFLTSLADDGPACDPHALTGLG
ncbi:hypothetical protein [Streptomyces sp. NBC_01435]|uniref:hypothetical protein n=1 Tax=Streptomyces sp. NBC_01435 TaxID=2903865 RepID=UPI002E324B50|nr:hypothetical protein [Streptomyces sp. NBC_01435]